MYVACHWALVGIRTNVDETWWSRVCLCQLALVSLVFNECMKVQWPMITTLQILVDNQI